MNEDHGRHQGLLALLLALFGALQAWLLLAPDALLMTQMEADVYHVLDGLLRIRDGGQQHIDFKTPLGVLALNALGIPMSLGLSPGAAMAAANLFVMALMIPATLWLHATRMPFGPALGLGLSAMLVAAALIWGGGALGASFAMFYNRWCWAMLMVALPILLIPHRGRGGDLVDGLVIGLVAAAFFYLKITYAFGFFLIGLVWLLAVRRWRAAGAALAVCLAALAAVTASFGGLEMLGGYMDDMADVSASPHRPRPGLPLVDVATRAEVIAISLTLFAALVVLARAGFGRTAAVWAAASAVIYYVAYQNFGNWPTGALALPFVLWALARRAPEAALAFGYPARRVMGLLAVGLVFSFAPTLALMQSSLVVTYLAPPSAAAAILAPHGTPDIAFSSEEGRYFGLDRIGAGVEDDPERRSFGGLDFPPCTFGQGAESVYPPLAEELRARLDLSGKRILLADTINPLWFLTGTEPIRGVHIWHYAPIGEKLGEIDLLVVPFCDLVRRQRNAIIDEVAESGLDFGLAFQTPFFAVFERRR